MCYNVNMENFVNGKVHIDKKLFEKFVKIKKPIPLEVLTGFFKCTLSQLQEWCKVTYGCTLNEKIKTSTKSLKKKTVFNEENFRLFTLSNQVDIMKDQKNYCIDRYVDFFSFIDVDELDETCKYTFCGRNFRQSVDTCIYYDRMDIYENLQVRRNESPNLLKHMAEVCLDLNSKSVENNVDTFKANAYIALNKFWDTNSS